MNGPGMAEQQHPKVGIVVVGRVARPVVAPALGGGGVRIRPATSAIRSRVIVGR
jgi:hypothetical protein